MNDFSKKGDRRMDKLAEIKKLYDETDIDIVNALLSTKKCFLTTTYKDGETVHYVLGYTG
jgi:hypothetical protein